MRAHLVQMDIQWEDRAGNAETVRSMLADSTPSAGDLVLLPELFDSGFSLNTDHTDDRDGATFGFLRDLAQQYRITLHGSRTLRPAGQVKAHNLATAIGPRGDVLADYAKIHPFSFGREGEAFEGGKHVTTYEWATGDRRLVVCPAVCYDLRFPELFRLGLRAGAELFALGANWPDARQHHWRSLAIARAIENQAFVLAVNRTGPDPYLNYIGGSIAVGPTGEVLGELGDQPEVLTVDLDPEAVRSWRERFPAWRDATLI